MSLRELQEELERVASSVLQKAGVDASCTALTVVPVGGGSDRRPVLRVMIDFVRWDPTSALRLLLGLAHIERGMRRAVANSWAAESCDFAGAWLHASDAVLEAANLRHLAGALGTCDKGFASSGNSTWDASSAPTTAYAPTVPGPLRDR